MRSFHVLTASQFIMCRLDDFMPSNHTLREIANVAKVKIEPLFAQNPQAAMALVTQEEGLRYASAVAAADVVGNTIDSSVP